MARGLSRLVVMWTLPDQGLNLCTLHLQAGSQPPDHQGEPAAQIQNRSVWAGSGMHVTVITLHKIAKGKVLNTEP